MIVTEKIDGTNAQVFIGEDGELLVGSRKRWITPDHDNFGFAAWAHEHKDELLTLGPGRHFGEWWGCGIQRRYGLTEKRFSLFNVQRWCLHDEEPQRIVTGDPRQEKYQERLPECCGLVPVLYRGPFSTTEASCILLDLERVGSVAAPGFMDPEGIVVHHVAGNVSFKKTLGSDGAKGLVSSPTQNAMEVELSTSSVIFFLSNSPPGVTHPPSSRSASSATSARAGAQAFSSTT